MELTNVDPQDSRRRTLAALCAAAADGDARAFEALHDRLTGGLRRYFLRRLPRGGEGCDELVQRTWIAVWRAISEGRYDPARAAITTYAYAVAGNVWLHFTRQRATPALGDAELEHAFSSVDDHDPAALVRAAELLEAVRACVRARTGPCVLDPLERQIVDGVSRGTPEREIAATLHIAASTVNVRKRAAFEKIRMCLQHKGFGSPFSEREGPDRQ